MVVPEDDRFVSQRARIGALAAKNRLPWLASWPLLVGAGALMSYGPKDRYLWERIVWYVDRILKGAAPADLPVEQPTKFELVINLKTAKALVELSATHHWKQSILKDTSPMRSNGPRAKAAP